jgi:hypothetical protein
MWDFIKSAPITFTIAGIIFLLAIVGVVVGVVLKGRWKDLGLIEREGKKLHWGKGFIPLSIIFHPALSLHWRATFVGASMRFKQAIGKDLFKAINTPDDYRFDLPPTMGSGIVVIQPKEPTGALQTDTASTEHRWDRDTGLIGAATITVPAELQIRMPIMLHELGHVLGLAHDEHPSSIMFPVINRLTTPGQVSKNDVDLLKKLYG